MGKKAADGAAAGEAAKAAAKPAAKGKGSDADSAAERLRRLRPAPRPVFFAAFVLFCAWLVVFYKPCDVKGSKKRDCGYAGISDLKCKTGACFTKGGKPFSKSTAKVKREAGASLGMSYSVDQTGSLLVQELSEGSVQAYNDGLPTDSEDRIVPGDAIVKVDGKTASGKMMDALKAKGSRTLELEVQRSRLPLLLRWIHGNKHLKLLEKVLTSPGFKQWWRSFWSVGRVGLACWYISGYPMASVPMYLTLSGAVAFNTARCCHDEKVPAGTAHCYRGLRESPEAILRKVVGETVQLGQRVARSPRSYFDWLLNPFAP